MTDKQIARRVARECRRLALQCADGTAPHMIAGHFVLNGQHCAIGWALTRAAPDGDPWTACAAVRRLAVERGILASPADSTACSITIDANNECRGQEKRRARVVFPLLALADAVDAAC